MICNFFWKFCDWNFVVQVKMWVQTFSAYECMYLCNAADFLSELVCDLLTSWEEEESESVEDDEWDPLDDEVLVLVSLVEPVQDSLVEWFSTYQLINSLYREIEIRACTYPFLCWHFFCFCGHLILLICWGYNLEWCRAYWLYDTILFFIYLCEFRILSTF